MKRYGGAVATGIPNGEATFIVPRAAVYRKTEGTLLVASEGTDAIVELDAMMSDPTLGEVHRYVADPRQHPNRYFEGGAPSGVALSDDEDTAYAYCRST